MKIMFTAARKYEYVEQWQQLKMMHFQGIIIIICKEHHLVVFCNWHGGVDIILVPAARGNGTKFLGMVIQNSTSIESSIAFSCSGSISSICGTLIPNYMHRAVQCTKKISWVGT